MWQCGNRGRGNRQATTDGPAINHRDGGHRQCFKLANALVNLAFVGHAILAIVKRLELFDIGAGDESLAASAAKRHDPQGAIRW